MLINARTVVSTSKVILVPYCQHHVPTYHDWMKDPDIQTATASEPLSLDEEYAMQKSWRNDVDKLTFILCQPTSPLGAIYDQELEIQAMVGDVNMFLSVDEQDDRSVILTGELELMIADKQRQRQGYGRGALLAFLCYITSHESDIVAQYVDVNNARQSKRRLDRLAVKIKEENTGSLKLFRGLGFQETSATPNYFGEYELEHACFAAEDLKVLMQKNDVEEYAESEYAVED